MRETVILIFSLFNLTFEVAGVDLSLGSVILGTLLISVVCTGIRIIFS